MSFLNIRWRELIPKITEEEALLQADGIQTPIFIVIAPEIAGSAARGVPIAEEVGRFPILIRQATQTDEGPIGDAYRRISEAGGMGVSQGNLVNTKTGAFDPDRDKARYRAMAPSRNADYVAESTLGQRWLRELAISTSIPLYVSEGPDSPAVHVATPAGVFANSLSDYARYVHRAKENEESDFQADCRRQAAERVCNELKRTGVPVEEIVDEFVEATASSHVLEPLSTKTVAFQVSVALDSFVRTIDEMARSGETRYVDAAAPIRPYLDRITPDFSIADPSMMEGL